MVQLPIRCNDKFVGCDSRQRSNGLITPDANKKSRADGTAPLLLPFFPLLLLSFIILLLPAPPFELFRPFPIPSFDDGKIALLLLLLPLLLLMESFNNPDGTIGLWWCNNRDAAAGGGGGQASPAAILPKINTDCS